MSDVVEWDVDGLVGVRIEGASASVVHHVTEELRDPAPRLDRPADIRIRVVDRLETAGRVRLVGLGQAAFDDEHFYLVGEGGARTRVDLGVVGSATELTVERGTRHIPLLVPLLALHLAQRDRVLLHASSFVHRGLGVLVAGWAKGGKSETLVPFMAAGAEFVADEWTIVGGRPPQMRGIASTALWEWHLRQYPQYWEKLSRGQRRRIGTWRAIRRVHDAVPGTGRLPGPIRKRLGRVLSEGGHLVQAAGQLDPVSVFDGRVRTTPAPVDRIILPVAIAEQDVELVATTGALVANRMVHSLEFERMALTVAYEQFRFAFPDRRNPLIEGQSDAEARILGAALDGIPAFELRHPYPVHLADLVSAAEAVFAD